MSEVRAALARKITAARDAELKRQLEQLGPGWAVGFRIKDADVLSASRQDRLAIEWEYHSVEVANGRVPVGLHGFCYVTLKDLEK